MNIKTKISLLIARVTGRISKEHAQIIEAALSTTEAGVYRVGPNHVLLTCNRKEVYHEMRAVIRNETTKMGIACTKPGLESVAPELVPIMEIIVEWNKHAREKYVGSNKEVRGNSHLRGRNDKNHGDDSSN